MLGGWYGRGERQTIEGTPSQIFHMRPGLSLVSILHHLNKREWNDIYFLGTATIGKLIAKRNTISSDILKCALTGCGIRLKCCVSYYFNVKVNIYTHREDIMVQMCFAI